jgi:DNA (cytosine-5)-methyltransferase 3A
MNVLSLFDGISCACVALERCGLPIETYTAVEIEKNATAISQKNYPEIIRHDDVRTFHPTGHYDLLIGGSPCQDLSIAKKDRKGLGGDRSGLFWEYIRIKNEAKPTWFVLENVASMPKKDRDIITREMGVEPVLFNASLVSAQSRKRLFWTNIPFELPADRGILLKDILQPDSEVDERMVMNGKAFCLTATYSKASPSEGEIQNSINRKQRTMVKVGHIGTSDAQGNRVYDTAGKSCTLSANGGGLGAKTGLYKVGRYIGRRLDENGTRADHSDNPIQRRIETREDDKCGTLTSVQKDNLVVGDRIRKLTPIECERLQGLPDNYTEGIAMTNRYKCLGNAFNVDVVCCILERLTRPM